MIYLDNAASAPVHPKALEAAMPFLTDNYANPSSVHSLGRAAFLALTTAREQCAAALGALPEEIFFTSGGTESDNLAIFSALRTTGKRKIVTTAIEHPAVLNACEKADIAKLCRVDPEGIVPPREIERLIDEDTALVSVMTANNEIGTLQPIAEIAEICRERGVLFHTDAVQAVGNVPINARESGIDMLSVSAHKIGGIKGAGLLFVRNGTPIAPMIFGGGQERGIRSGTENVAAIAALGAAIIECVRDIPGRVRRLSRLRDLLMTELEKLPGSRVNGSRTERLCGNVNVSFRDIDGEALVMGLDLMGICCSSASACSAGKQKRSHVLEALGIESEWLDGTIRLTLSDQNTESEIMSAAAAIAKLVFGEQPI